MTRRAEKYPFRELLVGDEFLVPCTGDERTRLRNVLGVTANTWHKHPDNFCRFVVSTVSDGVRAQRVA